MNPGSPSEPLNTRRPFTSVEAASAKIASRTLRSKDYVTLYRGIYLHHKTPRTPAIAAAAAIKAIGGTGYASHATAARIWGLPVPSLPGEHVTVTDLKERRTRTGINCHHTKQVVPTRIQDGVLCSAPEQTFVELARQLPLVELVVIGDYIVQHRMCSLYQLRQHCRRARGPGAASARAAAVLVQDFAESVMETRTRMLVVLAGLPHPVINAEFTIAGSTSRFDLCWPDAKVIVEYDGRHHIERKEQWENDLRRRERIEAAGWTMIVLVAADVYTTPTKTLERVCTALIAGGALPNGFALTAEWRSHFQDRSAA